MSAATAALVLAAAASFAGAPNYFAGAKIIGEVEGVRAIGAASAPAEVRGGEGAELLGDIAWSTAPPIGARAKLAVDPRTATVVARAGDDPLVVVSARGVAIAADASDPSNAALARWGYWPYLLYAANERANGRAPARFAEWPDAPVPRRSTAAAVAITCALLAAAFALALAAARRRARAAGELRAPEKTSAAAESGSLEKTSAAAGELRAPEKTSAAAAGSRAPEKTAAAEVGDPRVPVAADARALFAKLASTSGPAAAGWNRPGFARPLGGFFFFLSATLIAIGPYLWITCVLVPSRVQPFPDVDGTWAPVEELQMFIWAFADLGLTAAFVQRFAALRATDPARALRAAQLYFWWTLGAGLLQFAVGGVLACVILPHTRYALLSRVVLLRGAIQLGGVLSIFAVFFQAAQRFDYALGLDLVQSRLLYVALPIPLVLALRAWGRAHPAVGESFGALSGIAAGVAAASIAAAAIGYALYRRLRLPLAPLLRAGFDRATFVDLARFGLGVVASKAPFYLANSLEIAILINLLPSYPTWLGIRGLIASRLVFVLYFAYPFLDSGVPAFSEALAARKHALARYYVVRYLQFGNLFAALTVALLIGAGRPLVMHALGPEWQPVAKFLPLAAAVGLLLPTTWLSDSFQRGAGRPGLDAVLLSAEQALKLALLVVAIPRFGFAGLFYASAIAMTAKATCAWWINHRYLLRLELRAWTSFGAPLFSGAILLALLFGAARVVPDGRWAAIALFGGSALLAFPIGFALCGALGGLDAAALDEIDRAAALASFMRPVARVLARAARLGARVFPVAAPELARAADREAGEIADAERATAGPPAPDARR